MANWSKFKVITEVRVLSNQELIEDILHLAMGDDYDGCFTNEGDFRFCALKTELSKRLLSIGFIDSELE